MATQRVREVFGAVGLAAMLAACAGVGPPQVLDRSAVSGADLSQTVRVTDDPGDDEDPTLVLGRDGLFRVVWASGRDGEARDLYTRTSTDGVRWSGATRLTSYPGADEAPSILQARDGSFHLAWVRSSPNRSSRAHQRIWTLHSTDGQSWGRPRPLTDGAAHARAPTLYEGMQGRLWAVWSSEQAGRRALFTASTHDAGRSWSPATRITHGPGEDDFPHVIRQGDQRLLVWTRYAKGSPRRRAMEDRSAELAAATSSDGLRWSSPRIFSPENRAQRHLDVLPNAFTDLTGRRRYVSFTSSRVQPLSGDILFLDLDEPDAPPRQLTEGTSGESQGRVVPTRTPGEYLMLWVSTRTDVRGGKDLYVRRFRP